MTDERIDDFDSFRAFEIRAEEPVEIDAGLVPMTIAMDGIAVIVSLDNSVDGLTTEQVRDIYMGEITEWSEIDE